MVQWLGIHLPMQGTQVQSLVWEDSTCQGATKPMHHSYWAHALEPMLHSKRSHHSEKPAHHNEDPPQPKINRIKNKKKKRAAQRVKSPLINSYCNLQSANVNTCLKTSFTIQAGISTVTDKFCLSLKSTCIPKCGLHISELWEGDHQYSGEQGEGGRI